MPGSIRLFEDITRLIGAIRAEAKAMEPPDVVLDKAVKEIGNSIYGKIAQGVAGTRIIKDDIEQRQVFNTMFGVTDKMGPSAITNAPMAAYCTGLVRALLLETIGRLPRGTWVGTATTDGFLSTCRLEDIDQSGPVAMAFKAARERITPGDDTIWEVKHVVPGAIVTKTRGTYTVVPEEVGRGEKRRPGQGRIHDAGGGMGLRRDRAMPGVDRMLSRARLRDDAGGEITHATQGAASVRRRISRW